MQIDLVYHPGATAFKKKVNKKGRNILILIGASHQH